MPEHQKFIERAIELSKKGLADGKSGPFGAVIVRDNRIVGQGSNQVVRWNDPTAHAEMVAIKDACKNLDTFELEGCAIYASCEPCPMCLSAIYWSRIESIYYAATREDAAQAGFDDLHIYNQVALPLKERAIAHTNLMRQDANEVFKSWCELASKVDY